MNILLTGHRGRLGPTTVRRLEADGHTVRGFDIADGDDILDAAAIRRAAQGMDVIVHGAGLPEDRNGPPADTLTINLSGTANALVAAEQEGVARFVFLSSGKSLGLLERDPDYLPVDDAHRGLPTRPYGLAKWLSEEMCAAFTARTGMTTICLRPVAVFDDAGYGRMMQAAAAAKPQSLSGRSWHLGVHILIDDVADAIACAMTAPITGHVRLLLCAADIASAQPTRDLVAENMPNVPWRGGPDFAREPHRALIDIAPARRLLGWEPRRAWPGRKG